MEDPPHTSPEPRSGRSERVPDPPAARPVGSVSRYVGTRLVLGGRLLALLGLVLLAVVSVKVYLAYSRHELGTTITTGVAGGILAIALLSVGESLTRSGASYLRGEKHLARSAGRLIGRRRGRRARR